MHPSDVEVRQEVLVPKDEACGGNQTGNVVVEEAIKVETESSASARVAVGLRVAKSSVCIAILDVALQSPLLPCAGATEASQGFADHVAAVSTPALQLDLPLAVHHTSHVTWHVKPDARPDR